MRASTSLKSLRFAAALGLMFGALSLGEAKAANPLELNFWLSGPRYDGKLVDCDQALPPDLILLGRRQLRCSRCNVCWSISRCIHVRTRFPCRIPIQALVCSL